MKKIKLTLKTKILPSKKNSKQLYYNKKSGKRFITTSDSYKSWHEEAFYQLKSQYNLATLEKVEKIKIEFFSPNKRAFDLTNKAESIMDLMVDCEIIKDDNVNIVPNLELCYNGVNQKKEWTVLIYIYIKNYEKTI